MSRNFHALTESLRRSLALRTPDRAGKPTGSAAAVALVLSPAGEDSELLVIKRAVRAGDPWSGQMALPGGRRDDSDGSLLETARRETLEETGVSLRAKQCLGVLDDLRPFTPTLPPVTVRPFVFGLSGVRPEVTLNVEATKHMWIPLRTLRASQGRTPVTVRGRHLDVDAFLVGTDVIWGMTHRIIMPLLDLVNIEA